MVKLTFHHLQLFSLLNEGPPAELHRFTVQFQPNCCTAFATSWRRMKIFLWAVIIEITQTTLRALPSLLAQPTQVLVADNSSTANPLTPDHHQKTSSPSKTVQHFGVVQLKSVWFLSFGEWLSEAAKKEGRTICDHLIFHDQKPDRQYGAWQWQFVPLSRNKETCSREVLQR